jgi:hypothetical protein
VRKPSPEPIGHSAETSPATDDPPTVDTHDDMDSLPAQPPALVEAVLRTPRGGYFAKCLQDGALRRRSPERQPQEHRLSHSARGEADDESRDTDVKPTGTRRTGHNHADVRSSTELCDQRTAVEGVQPRASPPPGDEHQRQRCQRLSAGSIDCKTRNGARGTDDKCNRRLSAHRIRGRQAAAEARGK